MGRKAQRRPSRTAQAARRRAGRRVLDLIGQVTTQTPVNAFKVGHHGVVVVAPPRGLLTDPAYGLAKLIRSALTTPGPAPVKIYDAGGTLIRTATAETERKRRRWRLTRTEIKLYSVCPSCRARSRKTRALGWIYCCACGARTAQISSGSRAE